MKKIGIGAIVATLMAAAGLLLWQKLEISRLAAENADLRSQLVQVASLQDTNAQLAGRLSAAVESAQASQNELPRLRGQSSRARQLEQENTQLKAQRQELDRQIRQAQSVPSAVSETAKPTTSAPTTTELGILELADGVAARFDLGGGTNCIVTPTVQADGNLLMQIKTEATNGEGTSTELATSRLIARPGQHCSISVGDRMIALAVTLK